MVTEKTKKDKWRAIAVLHKYMEGIGMDSRLDKWEAEELVLFGGKILGICAALQKLEEEIATSERSPKGAMQEAVMLVIQFNAIPASIWNELPLTQRTARIYKEHVKPMWADGINGIRGFLARHSKEIGIKYSVISTKFPSTIGIEY